jgi:hypothetical protein
MKEISSMDFSQHGEVFYFYGQALLNKIFSHKQIMNVKINRIKPNNVTKIYQNYYL